MTDILAAHDVVLSQPGILDRSPSARRPTARRLKLCFIAETIHAGVGRHVVDLVTAFADRGFEIHLIYSPVRVDPVFLETLRRLPGVNCFAATMPRAIGAGDFVAFRRILQYVRANGPFDAIHGHSSKGGGYARLLKLFGFGPVFYSPHAFITMSPLLSKPKRVLYHTLEWLLSHLSDRIVCTSAAERVHAEALGLPASRLALAVNGYRPEVAPAREIVRMRLALRPNQIAIGFAGRLDVQKAPERIITAAKAVMPLLPNLVLVMVGDGPMRDALTGSIREAGLQDRVRWLGAVDARQYLPGFDMFVMPSLYEGCPYVLLEALSAGLPVICTPVGGTQEAVAHGVNGFVVAHNAPDQMVSAISQLASSVALRERMSESSRRKSEVFTIARMVQAIERLYLEASTERADFRPRLSPVPTIEHR